MPLTLPKISRTGTTPSRKRFWDNAREAIYGLQKVAGRHVTVDEHKGKGSIINVDDSAGRRPVPGGPGACCIDGECSVVTEATCTESGGNFLGFGTVCDDIDCTQGACCADDGGCTLTTEEDCSGTFQGYGTVCDPNPCPAPPPPPPCNGCGFYNPDDGLFYLTAVHHWTVDSSSCPDYDVNCQNDPDGCSPAGFPCPSIILHGFREQEVTTREHYNEDCSITTTTDNLTIELACNCLVSMGEHECLTGEPGHYCAVDTPDCRAEFGCPDDCTGITPPFGDCSTYSETVTYEDMCIP